jgi:hypothetical protein
MVLHTQLLRDKDEGDLCQQRLGQSACHRQQLPSGYLRCPLGLPHSDGAEVRQERPGSLPLRCETKTIVFVFLSFRLFSFPDIKTRSIVYQDRLGINPKHNCTHTHTHRETEKRDHVFLSFCLSVLQGRASFTKTSFRCLRSATTTAPHTPCRRQE